MKQKTVSSNSNRLKRSALAVAVIVGILLCVLIAWPFLGAITWALTLAILFSPLHVRVEKVVRHPNIAALLSTAIVIVVVVVPAIFVVERLITEAASGILSLQARVESGELQALLDSHPSLAPLESWIDRQFDLPSMMASVATWLSNIGATFVKGSLLQAVEVFITFYLLFYFLRDRLAAKTMIKAWLPLTPPETEQLLRRVVETVHATVYGTLAVAAVQGTLGGLMFWVLGLPTPLLWGLVMGLLSIVPVLGAFIVWIPAAILLILDGSWARALILAAWGGIVVGGIDNVLRPMFVGNRLRLHTIPAFISIVGGLLLFGAPGFILGPLAATMTVLLVEIWMRHETSSQTSE
ncbi:AI-2E family transporter [Cypionkella sp.]|uniref:AI-2E family transporter n=1 Tax=Cypionkella sp. TaxID=2811411 RepID=UPI002ABB7B34|nr:AI-2E family transporter [Cypionkella sp.]MDZ4394138.1 AI-2E family transporter [Cypionkella sp.]